MLKQWLNQQRFKRQHRAWQNSEGAQYYRPPTIGERVVADQDFLVLDFETTGLNPKQDSLLSAGWVDIRHGRIPLASCRHYLLQHTSTIPDASVAIHHITEQEAAQGTPIDMVLPELLQALSEKVLVAHFADIEVNFLQQQCKRMYGAVIPLITVDTLQFVYHMKYRDAVHVPQNALHLSSLRNDYHLPRYKAHNALSDAVATAELLLLLVEMLGGQQHLPVRQLIAMSQP